MEKRMKFWDRFEDEAQLQEYSGENQAVLADVNGHVHTPYSFSAFENIAQALRMSKEEGVKVLGINDFYSTDGYEEWAEKCVEYKVFPLFNIEFVGLSAEEQEKGIRINDPSNPGRIYISGKGLSCPHQLEEPYFSMLEGVKKSSNAQVQEMCEALNKHLASVGVGIVLSFTDIVEQYTEGLVRERHLAKVLRVKVAELAGSEEEVVAVFRTIFEDQAVQIPVGDDAKMENLIRGKLLKAGGAAFIQESPEQFLDLETIRQIILKSGGLPTYPLLADSVNGGYTEFEEDKERLLETLKQKGFYSVEFVTNRNTTAALEDYASFFVENGFVVTFGSEHNTPEMIPVELKTVEGKGLSDRLKEINYSNACIVAAHQYLYAKKGAGYLNEEGVPALDRVEELKALGANLIENFTNG